MKKYGLPYQGSKNKLAEWVLEHLPSAEHLYDVFAGGCAVTHAALLSDKFRKIHANDITDSVTLFKDALDGKYENESRWISREDFYRLKDSDPFVRIVWSFGNNQRNYLYSREIEPYKKAVHEMIYSNSPNDRRMKFREVVRQIERIMCQGFLPPPKFQNQTALERVKALRLTTLNQGGGNYMNKNSLSISIGDYRDLEILPDSVIYCDPPYKDTGGYSMELDHEAFYDWCEKQTALALISEYWMPEDRFVCIASRKRKSTFSPKNNALEREEKLFVPKSQHERYLKLMNK